MLRAIVACALILTTLCACVSLNDASRHLEQGMTEDQVKTAVGSAPQSVSLDTCGSSTSHPWQCKKYKYSNGWGNFMYIWFQQSPDSVWRVNSWDTY